MPSRGENGDGPALLRLRRWDPSQFQLKISEFLEASISPTRDILLLLSHQHEALLFPLEAGKTSRDEGNVSVSNQYPVISRVKSYCWGHWGDAYKDVEDSGFRELLVTSDDTNVTVHAFRSRDRSARAVETALEESAGCGKWVEWGPSRSMLSEDQSCSNSSTSEDFSGSSCIGETNIRHGVENAASSGKESTSRKPFRSFLTVVDATVSGGKFLVKFPEELSFPHSAEVVSFNIYNCTLRFFDFFLLNRKKENQNFGDVKGLEDDYTEPDTLGSKEQVTGQDSRNCITYKPSRVFSSSPHHLIGLVLKSSFDASVGSCEKDPKSKNFVVVIKLRKWSMEWVCAVNLLDLYSGSGVGLGREWVDFQFMGSFLVCLDTSGLICIYSTKTGNLVGHFNVLQSCGLETKVDYCSNQPKKAANEDSSPTVQSLEKDANQSHETNENEHFTEGIAHARAFRRLMVTQHSFLLASVDAQGFIYIVHAKDYLSKKSHGFSFLMPHPHYSDASMLAVWKTAGCGLGGQKVFPYINSHQGLGASDLSIEDFSDINCYTAASLREKNKYYMDVKGSQPNKYPSGFTAPLNAEGYKLSHSESETSCTPIRRIYLPLDRFNKEDSICFSAFGITRLARNLDMKVSSNYRIVHSSLHVPPSALDERDLYRGFHYRKFSSTKASSDFQESIGVSFQGCLYLVTHNGLYVVLPLVSVSSHTRSTDSLRFWQPAYVADSKYKFELLAINGTRELWKPWQTEVLDRLLLYESPEEADRICLENEWDLKIARMRRMQLSLHYLKSDEIEKSLHMLVHVNLAEEGVLRLLFTCVYRIFRKFASDNEVALASRLLSLAACFATKMVRRYGLADQKRNNNVKKNLRISCLQPNFLKHNLVDLSNSRRLSEMSHLLEVIRNLQTQLASKSRRAGLGMVLDGWDASSMVDTDVIKDDSPLPIVTMDAGSVGLLGSQETQTIGTLIIPAHENIAPQQTDFSGGAVNLKELYVYETTAAQTRRWVPMENSKDMIARWEVDHLDLKTVVKDALHFSRLPLAVLQLHIQRHRESAADKELHDTFSEVRDIGRAIAYDLFLKGESGLAVATLQRLGEDIETILRQLAFGTLRRSLRSLIEMEMKSYGYLRPDELRTFERISFIERLYSSSSFSNTYLGRRKKVALSYSGSTSPEADSVNIILHIVDHAAIKCGDANGVVIGSWPSDEGSAFPENCEDNDCAGYWVCAAVWSDAWDDITMDRIVLDQPCHIEIHVQWESQFEYHLSHNVLDEVFQLIDVIPLPSLLEGSLKVNLDHPISPGKVECDFESSCRQLYICPAEELEPVCMNIPRAKFLRYSIGNSCSSWLKMQVEQELAKKFIFFHDVWESTAEVIPLLVRANLIIDNSKMSGQDKSSTVTGDVDASNISQQFHKESAEALHKLLCIYCIQHKLPRLLDLYLDHHNLLMDDSSLSSLQEAAGECQWAKWLMLSRVKGHEYETSFSNARSNLSHNMIVGSRFGVQEIDEIVRTVDDMAEGGGELAALATLMHASPPMQKCICSGSVKRRCSLSYQCTLENLRPGLQHFRTLWKVLAASCLGHDLDASFSSSSTSSYAFGKSAFSDYLKWRDTIFTSAGGDTSLMQMLPCWFPKSIRRLITLFVQAPSGWQTMSGAVPFRDSLLQTDDSYVFSVNGNTRFSAISWEAAIQKSAEKELYSTLEDNDFGVEQHLHRGRALAAFNHLLGIRAMKLKSSKEPSGQASIQSDVQMLLAPLSENEGPLLSSVMPLAITHFDDPEMVASCAFLLELCGLSASTIRVDIAALRRISSYYNSIENAELVSPKGSSFNVIANEVDFTASLARVLADEYIHHYDIIVLGHNDVASKVSSSNQPSRPLLTILQHLEKASMPLMEEGRTCGSWLASGIGDGSEFRTQQKDASQHWNLVTAFCQTHHLPLSAKYLALLANDNDWVGFLTEAQMGRFPNDVVIEVAAKEFSDPRLRTHISTVLRSMQWTKKKNNSPINSYSAIGNKISFLDGCNTKMSVELFGLLAECERQKNPGEALLTKAKDLRWSLLAIIASCFLDVSPLSCLTVWLEITAARETSSIKVNDINSKITDSVGAAIEAINKLPMESRSLTFHYNRRSPKRRRLMDPTPGNLKKSSAHKSPNMPSQAIVSIAEEISFEEERKRMITEQSKAPSDLVEGLASLSNMVAVLCEQHLFLPLLRAFEMFLPSCSLLPFIRSLQAFSQMRLSESSAHLASFSARIKEESSVFPSNMPRDGQIKPTWTSSTAVKAAEAVLLTCPSAYEKRCLLQLLAAADFGDGGSASACFRRHYWKINLAEPSLRKDDSVYLGNEALDDASLLTALEKNGLWEEARNWARQLESSGSSWSSSLHHVTETQAESMVAEWKEFLWDVPEERYALWNHCQSLFMRYSFPPLQAGMFFLKHAESIEKEIPARELHEMLLLSLQWLSGTMTQSNPVYPLHLLREIETRVWLLAVESEAQSKAESDSILHSSVLNPTNGSGVSIIEHTASVIAKMDSHINAMQMRPMEKNVEKETSHINNRHLHVAEIHNLASGASGTRIKRRAKNYLPNRRPVADSADSSNDSSDSPNSPRNFRTSGETSKNLQLQEENVKIEASVSGWEEKVRPADLERAVLALLDFGQITAAKQLQNKLSPTLVPYEMVLVDAALKLATLSSASDSGEISESVLDPEVLSIMDTCDLPRSKNVIDSLQALESLATKCVEGSGLGVCRRIIAVVKAAKVLGVSFSEAFEKPPIELLQLLSLKAQDSLEEARLLVETHTMPPPSIARILAESFLKGLVAAHRGGYMDSQKEEGPAPLLWRFSDFLKWAELCPSEQEIGHELTRLAMTGQDIPHACEVELLILSHHFYKSSSCLDAVDVLVTLARNRVDSYVLEGDFSCLARLITGVSNFRPLNFILNILIENGQLELLLQKYSAAESATGTAEAVRGFRMAVLTSLKLFSPHDLDAFALVYNHFDMKHETASLLESRSLLYIKQWFSSRNKEVQTEDLLEAMHHLIEAAEVHSTIDAGQKTHRACARASLLSLQIRIPDLQWLELSETNARRVLVDQSRFQEALIVAEAYNLNQPSEWALVLWNQMLKPDLVEEFVAEFVAVLPLQSSMLLDLARFYRAEVAARGDQSHFSMWLSPGGLPAEWVKHLGRSFRSLLKRTRDLRVRIQLATLATGFGDAIDASNKVLDKVPDNAGPLILRKGHGGAYLPLM